MGDIVDFKDFKRKKEGRPPIDLSDIEDRLECLGFSRIVITEEEEPEREFRSKFGMGEFVSFNDPTIDENLELKGWIMSIEFFDGGVLYCIQGENNKEGQCIMHEGIWQSDIIQTEELLDDTF